MALFTVVGFVSFLILLGTDCWAAVELIGVGAEIVPAVCFRYKYPSDEVNADITLPSPLVRPVSKENASPALSENCRVSVVYMSILTANI